MFLKGVVLPILLAVLSITLIIVVINALFRLAQLDIWILRFAAILMAWYVLGPIILNWITNVLNIELSDGIKILYTPIQSILSQFNKLV